MKWTFRQKRAQELFTIPESERPVGCQTDDEIAATLGINTMTLRGWTLTPGWWEAISDIAAVYIGRHLYAIYKSMVKQATGGSVQAAKFCIAIFGFNQVNF